MGYTYPDLTEDQKIEYSQNNNERPIDVNSQIPNLDPNIALLRVLVAQAPVVVVPVPVAGVRALVSGVLVRAVEVQALVSEELVPAVEVQAQASGVPDPY